MILDLLSAGELHLTTVRLLGPHLTPANDVAVLESARRKKKVEVEEIVASLAPRADVAPSIRRLPQRSLAAAHFDGSWAAASATGSSVPTASATDPTASAVPVAPAHSHRSAEVRPLSPDRYNYRLTIGRSTLEKLRFAKDMLRHALPSGDDEAVLDRALTALLRDLARQKFGGEPKRARSVARPRSSPPLPGPGEAQRDGSREPVADSRYVPVAVKRAVWVRDLGRCAFVAEDGHRCGERAFVEFHHVRPWAIGGEPTVDNVELRCRRHNGLEARVFFAREPVAHEGPAAETRALVPERQRALEISTGSVRSPGAQRRESPNVTA